MTSTQTSAIKRFPLATNLPRHESEEVSPPSLVHGSEFWPDVDDTTTSLLIINYLFSDQTPRTIGKGVQSSSSQSTARLPPGAQPYPMTVHPCTYTPSNAEDLRRAHSITVSVQHLLVSTEKFCMSGISKKNYELYAPGTMTCVPYHAYEGPGAPPSDLGRPGDTFLDTTWYGLYARQVDEWIPWRGPVPSKRTMASILNETTWSEFRSLLIAHPDFPHADRFLWCDGHEMGWFGVPAISGKRKDMFEEMSFGLDDVGNGRVVVERLLEQRAKGSKRIHENAPPIVKSHKKARAEPSHAQDGGVGTYSAASPATGPDVTPVNDMMQAFGKAMEHVLGAPTRSQGDELKAAQVKIQTLEHQISELQLQHVMELNQLQNQLGHESEQRLRAEKELAREAKDHKKSQKRCDKLATNIQRMHSTLHDLFPDIGHDMVTDE